MSFGSGELLRRGNAPLWKKHSTYTREGALEVRFTPRPEHATLNPSPLEIEASILSLHPETPSSISMRPRATKSGKTTLSKTIVVDSTPIGAAYIPLERLPSADLQEAIALSMFFDMTSKRLQVRERTQDGDLDIYSIHEQDMERPSLVPLLILAAKEGLTDWRPGEKRIVF